MGIASITNVVPRTNFLIRNSGPRFEQIARLSPDSQILKVRTSALQSIKNIFLNSSSLSGFYDREIKDSHRTLMVSCSGIYDNVKAGKRFEYSIKNSADILAEILPGLNLTPDEIVFTTHLVDNVLPKRFIGDCAPYPSHLFEGEIDFSRFLKIEAEISGLEGPTKDKLNKRPAKEDLDWYFYNFGEYKKIKNLLDVKTPEKHEVYIIENKWDIKRADGKAVSVRDGTLMGLRKKILFEERTPSSLIGRIYTNGRSSKVKTKEYTTHGVCEREVGSRLLYERVQNGSLISAIENELKTRLDGDEIIFATNLSEIFLPTDYSGHFSLNGEYKPLFNLLCPSRK